MLKPFVFLIAFFLLFCFSCKNKTNYICSSTSVKVTVVNKSDHNIINIFLQNKQDNLIFRNLKNKAKTLLCFESDTESSYSLKVVLDNGDTLKTNGAYVERGYCTTEIVFADSIVTKYNPIY